MSERGISKSMVVPAMVDSVWEAWTTEAGVKTFFAPEARVELSIGGPYEMLFNPEAPVGSQGGEGLTVLSYLPREMLSFEWNAPPEFPKIRQQKTWVVVHLDAEGQHTRVRLAHLGFGRDDDWDRVYNYFVRAWDVVLGRLAHRFAVGPIDWSDPYRPPASVSAAALG